MEQNVLHIPEYGEVGHHEVIFFVVLFWGDFYLFILWWGSSWKECITETVSSN